MMTVDWTLLVGMVQQAVTQGAEVLTGGDFPAGLPAPLHLGHYYSPTVIAVTPKMNIWTEEVGH